MSLTHEADKVQTALEEERAVDYNLWRWLLGERLALQHLVVRDKPMPPVERAVAIPQQGRPRGHSQAPNAEGWICPRCHRVYSPYVASCHTCEPRPRSQTGQVEYRG